WRRSTRSPRSRSTSGAPLSARIRVLIHQTHDAAGNPAPAEYVFDVVDHAARATSENLLDALRPLAPRESGRSGAYWYRDARGTGLLEVTGASRIALGELDDAIRTIEIGENIGEPEVFRQENLAS